MSRLEEFPNLQWTRCPGAEDYFDRADALRERFQRLALVALGMLVLIPCGACWVVLAAQRPTPVEVFADGRIFSGSLRGQSDPALAREALHAQMRDTLEVLLTRTEQGGVPALGDFTTPGVAEVVDADFAPAKKMAAGYSQSFSITSTRTLVARPDWIVLGVRGLLASRTLTGYQPTELFLIAGFAPGRKTQRNALGWRLTRLLPDPEGRLYFHDEIAQEDAVRFGLPAHGS